MQAGFEDLDARRTTYQFDLERDVPWGRAGEPGVFFTAPYLRALGFDVAALEANAPAMDRFQRLLALCTCRTFAGLEDDVITFLQDEQEDVPLTRSATLLMAEEVKHTILFRRFAALLDAQRPGLAAALDRHYAPPPGLARLKASRAKLGSPAVLGYLFWLNTMFFEQVTMFLYSTIAADAERIQPTWLAMHRCHFREEAQHVATDRAYLRRCPLTAEERDRWSKAFYLNLEETFQEFFCLDSVEKTMRDEFPSLALYARPPRLETLPLMGELLSGTSFALVREAAPYLRRYAESAAARGGAAAS